MLELAMRSGKVCEANLVPRGIYITRTKTTED
jgi:hypothetical protein